jgi:hypothetical protein
MVMFRTVDLSTQRFAARRAMEQIVRPFVTIDSSPPAPPTPRKPLPGEGGEAFDSWGGPSRFSRPDISDPIESPTRVGGGGFKVEWPKDDKQDSERVRVYSEIRRETEEVRVENPDDEDQYVMVERIKSIDFSTPDGWTARFVLKWT